MPPLRRHSPVRAVRRLDDLAVGHPSDSSHGVHRFPSTSHACCVHLSTDTPKRIRVPGSARPGVFRPCRSSRLRRFPPQRASLQAGRSLALRRFVAPCSRPWGSPCFEPSLRPASVIRRSPRTGRK
jgi:hypothetical protein